MQVETLTPVGRMVQGDPFVANTTDMKGKPLTNKDGTARVEYFCAIAVPKTDAAVNEFWAKAQQVAAAGFPGGLPAPGFAPGPAFLGPGAGGGPGAGQVVPNIAC